MPILEYRCDECSEVFEILSRTQYNELVKCPQCQSSKLELLPSTFATSNQAIHASERPIIFRNPRTGEVRYPPTRDAELHPKYVAQGYQRQEAFTTFGERDQYEKSTGRIHERSHYDPGSATAERDLTPSDGNDKIAAFQKNKKPARL